MPSSFTLTRVPLVNRPRHVTVAAVRDLTPTYRRITFTGDLDGFESAGSDDHLRVFFVEPGATPTTIEEMRSWPSREYTPVAWSETSLDLDFVIHGSGPGSTWASEARPGDTAMIGGPRGSQVLDGDPAWWLLAGDRTALPAIRRFAAAAAPGTPVDVVVVADDPADEQALTSRGDLTVTWVRTLDALVDALAAAPHHPGDGFAFLGAEQSAVRPVRELLTARGVDLGTAVVKGYWKRGEPEYHAPH